MACEICDHTMQRVNDSTVRTFWCPRCGTLKTEMENTAKFDRPKIVGRAFAFADAVLSYMSGLEDKTRTTRCWQALAECVRQSANAGPQKQLTPEE